MAYQVVLDREGDMFVVEAEDCDHFVLFCRPCGVSRSLQHWCADPAHPVHNVAPIGSILHQISEHRATEAHQRAVLDAQASGRTFYWPPASEEAR